MTVLAAEETQVGVQLAPQEREHALLIPGHKLEHNAGNISGRTPSLERASITHFRP